MERKKGGRGGGGGGRGGGGEGGGGKGGDEKAEIDGNLWEILVETKVKNSRSRIGFIHLFYREM